MCAVQGIYCYRILPDPVCHLSDLACVPAGTNVIVCVCALQGIYCYRSLPDTLRHLSDLHGHPAVRAGDFVWPVWRQGAPHHLGRQPCGKR